jgi:hypothetical protein
MTVADTVAGTGLYGLVWVRRSERHLIERIGAAKFVQTRISGPARSAKPLCAGSIPARASNFTAQRIPTNPGKSAYYIDFRVKLTDVSFSSLLVGLSNVGGRTKTGRSFALRAVQNNRA